ncbi:MAG: hypothetical protein AABX17_03820 [Nanoarchaeota archaeon]
MRFEVLKRGTSHRRHEYLLNFHEIFNERKFIDGFNLALNTNPDFADYNVVKRKSGYCLTNGASKVYAELSFAKLTDSQLVMLAVKRVEMPRERLNEILETLISGRNFSQQESQPCRHEQLDLFQSG